MARPSSTADAFTAIAEPRRRELLRVLADPAQRNGENGEALSPMRLAESAQGRDVTWLVQQLGWPQPQVSKHLAVLRKVGLVSVVRNGKHRVYSLNGDKLRPVFDWVKAYERFWEHQLDRIQALAEEMQREADAKAHAKPTPKPKAKSDRRSGSDPNQPH